MTHQEIIDLIHREVKPALGCTEPIAVALAVAHNHPTGHLTPSREDKSLTCRLLEAGKVLNIRLIEHLIVGIGANNKPDYYSFHDNGLV